MPSPLRWIGLIALVLALPATVVAIILGILPDGVTLPLLVALLAGIGIAVRRVKSAYGTRTTLAVVVLGIIAPLAGSVFWLVDHPDAIKVAYLRQLRNKALANTRGEGWTEQMTGLALVRYQVEDRGAGEVLEALPESVALVQAAFTQVPERFYVFVFPDVPAAERGFGERFPSGMKGAGLGREILVMTSPAGWPAIYRADRGVVRIVAHELTHMVAFDLGGPGIPNWLQEGLGVYVAGQIQPVQQEELARQVAAGKRYSLAEIDGLFAGLESVADVGPGYILAGSIVQFLFDQYSFGTVEEVLAELGAGQEIDQALRTAIGTDGKGLEAAWHQWLIARAGR